MLAANTHAQNKESTPFTLGTTDKIESEILSETRLLNIYLPSGYNDSNARYPVIYLLDGSADEDFIHVVGVTQFLTMINVLPPSILVGIANVDRRRDFVFPLKLEKDKKLMPTAGGSAKFIAYLEQEVQPYVEQHYRTTARKTLIGQSLGGLLATEILLKKPELFTDYIIVSPSLWADDETMLVNAQQQVAAGAKNAKNVYITVGSEGKQMIGDAKKLAEIVEKNGKSKYKVHYVYMPKENHLTILHNALYQAFETLNKK